MEDPGQHVGNSRRTDGDSMNQWVLIISMFSPGGDYLDKRHVVLQDQRTCQSAKVTVETAESPMGIKVKGLCVTYGHWTGRKPMRDVPMD